MRICTFADALLTILPALTAGAADNTPPEWFSNLFNSKDLTGWKDLVSGVKADAGVRKHLNNPAARAKFSPEELAAAR